MSHSTKHPDIQRLYSVSPVIPLPDSAVANASPARYSRGANEFVGGEYVETGLTPAVFFLWACGLGTAALFAAAAIHFGAVGVGQFQERQAIAAESAAQQRLAEIEMCLGGE